MKQLVILYILFMSIITCDAHAYTRIKDIVYFEGVRENVLVGYGLAVGLNGTGDNLRNSGFTQNTIIKHLNNMGVSTRDMGTLNTKNVASVMVTGNLPAFAQPGNLMSVQVSTMGDAKSLKGGSLIATPMIGPDGQVYAIAQGSIMIGEDQNARKTTPTSGYITNGAIVEQSVGFNMNNIENLKLALKNPDITTARVIATAINSHVRDEIAQAKDPGTVFVRIPISYKKNVIEFLSEIEGLSVDTDAVAKIIIDEATGTVVIGDNVKISKVAIAQGNLVLKVSDVDKMRQFLQNDNEYVPNNDKIGMIESNATLSDLVQGLNALGVQPQDLIAILKSIQQAGALQASIEMR